jgi:hypothetical protein
MENLNLLFSSRGLLKSTDLHDQNPISSTSHINFDVEKSEFNTIYICTDALKNFIDNYLWKIQHEFTIITGDSDASINAKNIEQYDAILNSKYVKHWFAQNSSLTTEKITQIPIGLDYHTAYEKPGIWTLTSITPLTQELNLRKIFQDSKETQNRIPLAYCNWQHAINRGDRQECINNIDKSICFFEKNHIPRASTWKRQSEFLFIISPMGEGFDCHRTWEAIALGCIPIVKTGPIDNLFNDLPVLIVDRWSDVNINNLSKAANDILNKSYDFSPLFMKYWLDKIELKSYKLPRMKMREFKKMIADNFE